VAPRRCDRRAGTFRHSHPAPGLVFSLVFLAYFDAVGFLQLDLAAALAPLVITTLVATVVEAYTPADLDNLTVPAAALSALWIIIPMLNWWQVSFVA